MLMDPLAFAVHCRELHLTAEDVRTILSLAKVALGPEGVLDALDIMEEMEADDEAEESIARDEERLDAYLASLE